jgi:hypothetical protein
MNKQYCINCKSKNLKIAYSKKLDKWFRKCLDCNWVNNYLEELSNDKM